MNRTSMRKIKEHLTSYRNRHVRFVIELHKAGERRKSGLFPIEGLKEIQMAIRHGYHCRKVFFCPELITWEAVEELVPEAEEYFSLSRDLYGRMVYREDSGGVVVVAEMKSHHLDTLKIKSFSFLVVLEAVEKPGNLGAILRTADAAGVDAVLIGDPRTDLYNPNVIRASIGCLFSVPVYLGSSEEIISALRLAEVQIVCTSPSAKTMYYDIDYSKSTAIVLGTESSGLSEFWKNQPVHNVSIPMKGEADSLNVSTSAAIIIFEVVRQRYFSSQKYY